MFQRIMSIVILSAALAFIAGAWLLAAGCDPTLTPQTKQTIGQIQQKNAVDVAKAKADATLKSTKAAANPLAHPFTANADAAKQARGLFLPVAVISLLVAGGFIGLCFTPLSWFSKIGLPIAAGVCGVSWFGVFALPFLPWVGLAVGVGVIGLFVWELSRAHWKLPEALKDIEQDLGIARRNASIAATDASKALTAAATAKAIANTAANKIDTALAGTPAAPIVTVTGPVK